MGRAGAPVEKRRGVESRMGKPPGRSKESRRMGVREEDIASAMAERPLRNGVPGIEAVCESMLGGDLVEVREWCKNVRVVMFVRRKKGSVGVKRGGLRLSARIKVHQIGEVVIP